MFRMVSLWDLHSRTTTSGGDAQVAGTLAIYSLERDIKPAGMGFGQARHRRWGATCSPMILSAPVRSTFPLRPVHHHGWRAGRGARPDRRALRRFFVLRLAETPCRAPRPPPRRCAGATASGPATWPSSRATRAPVSARRIAHWSRSRAPRMPDNKTLYHGIANYTSFYTGPNLSVPLQHSRRCRRRLYQRNDVQPRARPRSAAAGRSRSGQVLSRTELIFNTPVLDVAENVINLKAQYGVDADGNGRITDPPRRWTHVRSAPISPRCWRFGSPSWCAAATSSAAPMAAPRRRRASPRTQPTWANGTFLRDDQPRRHPRRLRGRAEQPDPNNWRFYRYRVYEKVIPLRNMIWGNAP